MLYHFDLNDPEPEPEPKPVKESKPRKPRIVHFSEEPVDIESLITEDLEYDPDYCPEMGYEPEDDDEINQNEKNNDNDN